MPVGYVWDDHDYGPNDAGAASPTRDAVRAAYRTAVPHYELPSGDGAINQAFTIGRVRFVITDGRSERTAGSLLGDEQRRWLIDELTAAGRTHALVVWANATPWIGAAREGADTWAGFGEERAEIGQALADAGIDNLVMVSGDAHMVAIDDGTNSGYAAGGEGGFPVLQAAAPRPGVALPGSDPALVGWPLAVRAERHASRVGDGGRSQDQKVRLRNSHPRLLDHHRLVHDGKQVLNLVRRRHAADDCAQRQR